MNEQLIGNTVIQGSYKMKKLKFLLLSVGLLILTSCDVNDTENQDVYSAFSLTVGNKYSFKHSSQTIG